jgi:hypothetical protein
LHAAGSPLATRAVEKMVAVHGKAGRAPVAPHFYAFWLDSLLKVIVKTDPIADTTLMTCWTRAMNVVIQTFIDQYEMR